MTVKFNGAIAPQKATENSAGFDVASSQDCSIMPGETLVINTKLYVEPPPDAEIQVRPRSGLSKQGILVHLGTIDPDYRGEIGVIVTNCSDMEYRVRKGDRIAQLVIKPIFHVAFEYADELSSTERGEGGFGSTGR